MTLDEMRYRLNELRMMLNDGEHGEEQGVLVEIISELDKSALSENKGEWIIREDNTSFVKQIPRRWVECSHCGWSFSYDRIHDDFCSKCGARMKGGE